ncbi:MMS19 nucleotide excision repair protein homolog [Zerene cesonia]|uniref:MMS19 nucleotide excision repair protein homolog n=1 Tax=Zerene cesonia TaxID=33412 RepID=UPI0018E52A17|nr:MMS19 nucleotide excision repair protein homolog [Zerene cesonia]
MEPIWFKPDLAEEIINQNDIFNETHSIITDIVSGYLDITKIVENMGGALTNKDAANREKGMRFFTKILKELPRDYLSEVQINFISKFYIDRLKDNHRVIPAVLEGYLTLIEMKNYNFGLSAEYFTVLFREVACQSQLRQDRQNIYMTIQTLLDKDIECLKQLGPDFVYGVISAIDGERDPRNLLFLFSFLPKFLANISLGHLVDEMFEVISCYYPIDFHPSPDDPAAVSRDDLAKALCPCLCAVQEFGEQCLVLLIEKLDSSLRIAKLDSLNLLAESCKTFKPSTYSPFVKALWSSIHREIYQKTDEELIIVAHEALSALVANLATSANTDQCFENFVKGILISMQTSLADSNTVSQFVQASRVLLTTANSSKESCIIVTQSMIPAIVAYYGFKTSLKLQVSSLEFLGDMYDLAKKWDVLNNVEKQIEEIPTLCLTAVSEPEKEHQIAGFKTLIRAIEALKSELVLPFVEILIHVVQHSEDDEVLLVTVETVHAIARKFPELIMDLVVKGKCSIENIGNDKIMLQKRLNLLSNLASIDDFTKVIIEEMLQIITVSDENSINVVKALSGSISNTSLYTHEKVSQIESDHGLIDSILNWLLKEIKTASKESLEHGYMLISNTMCSLPAEKQMAILEKHSSGIVDKCKSEDLYFPLLECLYRSLHKSVTCQTFNNIMTLSLSTALNSENEYVRTKACCLVAHFLNKADYGQKFELSYELLKNYLSSCSKDNQNLCSPLIQLFAWITKALILRGSDTFMFWLQKLLLTIANPDCCKQGSEAIKLIMSDYPDSLNSRLHCRTSILYKQRMFQSFAMLADKLGPFNEETKEAYLLSWAYVLEKAPKTVLKNEVSKVIPLVVDGLDYDNKDLLIVMIDILIYFVEATNLIVAQSLQTILPRLVKLSGYMKSMDVRIKSLQCLYEIANSYKTALLLPYKSEILFDLAPSLDDKKRLVRNMAVRARTRWYLVGAPGEDKAE